ncbi:MAG: GNAT family N-acetyltransferase [Proteobacteria bacterium]|nr:GNAT family N-acetyltransferase [Pseudomonadota bacterium]
MAVTIRSANAHDAALIHAFVRELAAYENLLDSLEATERMIAAALFADNPRVFCDIADWDGRPAGFAMWFISFSSFRGRSGLYLEDLFVRPAFRRKGIATALFAHLARRCVREGMARFEWTVLDWNKPAIGFYRALGAELMDEWTICRVSGAALQRLARHTGAA